MRRLLEVEKQTNNKYLNLYIATYKVDGKKLRYEFASRRSEEDLAVFSDGKVKGDAVRIIPYFYENGKMKVVLIREFRNPINSYLFGVPAGLIDEGEDADSAAKRELREEVGAEAIKLVKTESASYSSAGMTDEAIVCYEAEIGEIGNQALEESEDISVLVVDLEDLGVMLDYENFGLQSRLQLRAFYYKHRGNVWK